MTFTLLASTLLPVSIAGTVQGSSDRLPQMSSFNLSSQKWQTRILLIFAPSVDNYTYQQQMRLFQHHNSGFADRNLIVVQVLATDTSYANGQLIDESSAANLRDKFRVDKDDFRVILVGKDGGVKRQEATPVQATAIFEQIDAMPMRQQEIQQRGRK